MSVELNHLIVPAPDKAESARFLTDLLDLDPGKPWGPFVAVTVANGVTLDYQDSTSFAQGHYAFLVDDETFGRALERIRSQGVRHWADPFRRQPGRINHDDGGRGVYFEDPGGHNMEIITVPYGGTPAASTAPRSVPS